MTMNYYTLPKELERDIEKYDGLVKGYLSGSVSAQEMKAFRVPMGIYEQRVNGTFMMRIRLPGGAITPSQLEQLAELASRHTDRDLHLTTRQDIQLHSLSLIDTVSLLRSLKTIGLSPRGGGGNTVRNVTGSWDAGINRSHAFDVSPYVQALTTRLIAEDDSWTLPRKFKIAFSGDSKDSAYATVSDLGFIAKAAPGGERGFSVYIAGGMGRKSRVAALLYEFSPDSEVYNIAKAAKNLFDRFGNRKNKHQARLRFLFEKFGKEKFIAAFEREIEEVRKQGHKPLELAQARPVREGYVEIPLFKGDIGFEKAKKLAHISERFGEDSLRVTPVQNFIIRNIDEKDVGQVREELVREKLINRLPPLMESAVSCAGASTCRLGICRSRSLLEAIGGGLEARGLDSNGKLSDVRLKISGCPNACGQHLIGDIGFFGAAKRNGEALYPAYVVLLGGLVSEKRTQFGEMAGVLPAKRVPGFLGDFLEEVLNNRKAGEPFYEYLAREGIRRARKLIEGHSHVPQLEDDPAFYIDFGDEKRFSLLERMEGECSAGVFDLIEYDLKTAEEALASFNGEESSRMETLYRAIAASSRALLITKGLEAGTKADAVLLFKEHFIGLHLEQRHAEALDAFLNREKVSKKRVEELFLAVKDLYDRMDVSLRFPEIVKKEEVKKSGGEKHFRDFRGVACPLNYVKTKLVLEDLKPGEVLEILLDDGEPIENVPASVLSEGHLISEQKKIDGYWSVTIVKGGSG